MRLLDSVLECLPNISRPQKKFLRHVLELLWLFPGSATFRNLSRYSDYCEKSFARWYSRELDFVSLNHEIILSQVPVEHKQALALDASFISKSGKNSYGLGSFWNGCHSRSERGQEISVLAWVDIEANTAYALSVEQTPGDEGKRQRKRKRKGKANSSAKANAKAKGDKSKSRNANYLDQVCRVASQVKSESLKYLLTDGAYSNKDFIDGVVASGLQQIGKLRRDSQLRYLYEGARRPGPGRSKCYDGVMDVEDLSRFDCLELDKETDLYIKTLNHPRFKRDLRVVVVVNTKTGGYALLFSTDTSLDARTIYEYYKARFQIEFIFRDAKQFTGLGDCQARSREKLATHFNLSLSALNLAKVEQAAANEPDAAFSMASLKRRMFNQHLIDRILSHLDCGQSLEKFSDEYSALCNYGIISQQAA